MFILQPLFCVLALLTINTSAQPYYVAYIDFPTCSGIGTSTADAECLSALGVPGYSNHNFNVLIFAFYVSKDDTMYDAANVWANPSSYFTSTFRDQIVGKSGSSDWEFREALKQLYSNAGIKVLLSVFGATDYPMASGLDADTLANTITNMVWTYSFDGVDVDYEETAYFASNDGVGEDWLITLTQGLRNRLGSSYIITHAPMAPYFMGSPNYLYGGYLYIHQQIGDQIDWYNVQFYNQGSTTYDSYNTLFVNSNGWSLNSAVFEMIQGSNSFGISIPAEKIVVGKYVRNGVDGSVGWVSANNLKSYISQASPTWSTGFMIWQFPGDKDQNFAFSNTVIEAFESGNNIKITNSGTLGAWWYAGVVSDVSTGFTISNFEIYHNNYWFGCIHQGWAWTCAPGDTSFVLPLTVRLTTTNGVLLISYNLITSYTDGSQWNFGSNF